MRQHDLWLELARDSRDAALELGRDPRFWRSVVSRSYYAGFAAVVGRLQERGRPFGQDEPSHSSLPNLIKNDLTPELGPDVTRNSSAV